MENSHISWTDNTFNPWIGCTKVSPGCTHCYAETRDIRFAGGAHWGKGAPRQRTAAVNWRQPLKWNAAASDVAKARHATGLEALPRPRVFCASLADWLDDEVPIEWLADLLDLIRRTPNLDWLLLTKRPGHFFDRVTRAFMETTKGIEFENWAYAWTGQIEGNVLRGVAPVPPANVWIGTTVEDQTRADERIPLLLSIPAKVRFLSCEPLLGPLNLTDGLGLMACPGDVDWVICGGESGPGARPMHPDWARSLRDQCAAAGVAFHFKQWGEWRWDNLNPFGTGYPDREKYHFTNPNTTVLRIGTKPAGRLLDGVLHDAVPTSQLQSATV